MTTSARPFVVAACLFASSSYVLAQPDEAVALAAFEALVARCQAANHALPSDEVQQSQTNAQQWLRLSRQPSTLSYDVKRTDSLVSPVSGQLRIVETMYRPERTWSTEAEAAAASMSRDQLVHIRLETRLEFSYQQKQWGVRAIRQTANVRFPDKADIPEPTTVSLTPESFVRNRPDRAACLP